MASMSLTTLIFLLRNRTTNSTPMTSMRIEKPVTIPAMRPMGKPCPSLLLLPLLAPTLLVDGVADVSELVALLDGWDTMTVLDEVVGRDVIKGVVLVMMMVLLLLLLVMLVPRGGPTEMMMVGVGVVGTALDESTVDAMVSDEAVFDDGIAGVNVLEGMAAEVVARLGGWLIAGQVTPAAQGSMEQQP